MTVLAIRIKAAPSQADSPDTVPAPGPPSWVDALADRVEQHVLGSHTEVVTDERSPPRTVGGADTGPPEHVRALYRFDGGESLTAVLDDVEQSVVADADWYRLESHTDCDHDEPPAERTGCGKWTVEREAGAIPDGV